MSIDEQKLIIWCNQVDRRLDRLEGKNCKPTEPLIKDEKIRKAVRAWAEANDFVRVFYEYDYSNDVAVFMVGESKMTIESDELLDDSKNYTIAELCGEEGE